MPEPVRRKLLLVGWDGADWRLIKPLMEKGELPNLERLVETGAMGNLASTRPLLSPLIWNSIATGMLPDKHGILGFTEIDEETGQVRPSTSVSRKVKAIWNILTQEGRDAHVVNWFSSHPAEPISGVCVSELYSRSATPISPAPRPVPPGVIHPADLHETLADLRVFPGDIDSQTVKLFVPRLGEVDQNNDQRLESIARMTAECLTVHSAATWILENRPWDFLGVYYGGIDHFCHGFMRYHPPRMERVDEKDFALFKDVVNSAYRLHDLMLGRLIELAGEDATIILCSDHGCYAGDLRPQRYAPVPGAPADDHRPIGVIVLKGPGIRHDELIHGASVLDITPTILSLFDLPVGRDMDGRPLLDAFEEGAGGVKTIPSWEEVEGEAGMHPSDTHVAADDSRELINQFVALGYLERPQRDEQWTELTRSENQWNLARIYLRSQRYPEALPLLEELYATYPLRGDFGLRLAECQFRLGMTKEAREVVAHLAARSPDRPQAKLLLGIAALQAGELNEALDLLLEVEKARPRAPGMFVHLGSVYLRLRRLEDAKRAFQRALKVDPDTPAAHLGLARCFLRQAHFESAAESALHAVALDFGLSEAHFVLGEALVRLGNEERAIQALDTSLRFVPGQVRIHRILAHLYGKRPDGEAKSEEHRILLKLCIDKQREQREKLRQIREESAKRAAERQAGLAKESEELMAAIRREEAVEPAPAPAAAAKPGTSGREFLIVSGLPRSGTSLMMQMLLAGGIPAMTDGKRSADDDNPEGYYEWEAVKRLGREPGIIEQTGGKAVKVISVLLSRLPREHRYKVIFLRRPVEEIAASQLKMIARRGGRPTAEPERINAILRRHQERVIQRIERAPHADVLVVDFPDLVADPAPTIERLREFLGAERLPSAEAMASVVKPELHRQRSENLQPSEEHG